jgi:hypothetical protein
MRTEDIIRKTANDIVRIFLLRFDRESAMNGRPTGAVLTEAELSRLYEMLHIYSNQDTTEADAFKRGLLVGKFLALMWTLDDSSNSQDLFALL